MNYNLHDDYYYYDIVRKNIRRYRKLANLTQQQLADAIDVSMHYISQIESANPNKYFTLVVIGRIAWCVKYWYKVIIWKISLYKKCWC